MYHPFMHTCCNTKCMFKSITRFKLFSPSSILAEKHRYLLYNNFSYLDFYTDIGSILSKIKLSVTYDPITHTAEKLVEVRDSGCSSDIINYNIIGVLLDQF